MKNKLLIVFLLFFSFFLENNLNAKVYNPTPDELLAYNVCSSYVISKKSLQESRNKEIKKMYKDFLKDFDSGNCGDKSFFTSKTKDGSITIKDPYNNKDVYKGMNVISHSSSKTQTKYESALQNLKIKIDFITNFYIDNYKFTAKNKIDNILKRIKEYNIKDKEKDVVLNDLKNISRELKIKGKFQNTYKSKTRYDVKIYTIIASALLFISLVFLYFLLR